MRDFKEEIVCTLKKQLKVDEIKIEVPPSSDLGDYAFPCFELSKILKKNPVQIAKELSGKIKIKDIEVKAIGPYLNFFVKKLNLSESILIEINKKGENYGSSNIGKGKKLLIEHTSINPNASPHVGRARNAIIGDSIVKVMKFQGYKTEVHYFVNDVGKQIAMLVLGAKGKKKVEFGDLLKIYVNVNKKIEKKPELEKEVFALLNKLESGDKETKKKFAEIVDICVKGQAKILGELGIKYDSFDYESEYLWNKSCDEILEKLKKTGKLFEDEEKRMVLNQEEYNLPTRAPFLVLTRADKTSLYPLRDIAYTIDKMKKVDKNVLVLGEDQKLYFQQVKSALNLIGYQAPEEIHYSFVLLSDGKMSTRSGNVVLLEDFMNEALQKAKDEIKKRHREADEKTAKAIAYGAVKYAMLRVANEKNVTFDWQSALNFEGESAPYLQYSHARICSILRKYGKKVDTKVDFSLLNKKNEEELVSLLGNFVDIVKKTAENYSPHIIANYLIVLSQKFNEYYHKTQILQAEEDVKKARLVLISCVKQVLENGLNLLGIEAPERM